MNKKNIFIWLAFGLIMAVSFNISKARSLSMHFVDEEDHMAGAELMNRGYKLHEQIQGNHQPLVYAASAAIQRLTKPNNMFMLVRRHRQSMFIYGLVWSAIILWRFKTNGLIFIVFFEFLKYGLFGNLLLMESLAAYPAVYLFFVFLGRKIPHRPELIWLGLSTFVIVFSLVPLYPWLIIVWLGLLLKLKLKIIWPLLAFGGAALLLFSFYSPTAWFRETIYNNWLYAIPALNPVKTGADWLKIIFFPFQAWLIQNSLQAQFIRLFLSGFLIASVFKPKLLLLYPLLVLANNRVLTPAAAYYQGFHLLPWLGLMIALFAFSITSLKLKFKLLLVIWAAALMLNKNMTYFLKTEVEYEYFVNYSTLDDVNFAIKNIKLAGDRLAVTANQPLIYWQTGTDLATRQMIYGGWEPKVPELKVDYERVFYGDNPPEIIFGNDEPELLTNNYLNIFKHGQQTELFIRNDRAAKITDAQWAALATRGFSK